MVSTIGIKIADGKFYPVLEENSAVKKRLILTTVHDDQKSVQIDLYKSLAKTMADAQYAGSLVIENLSPKPKGAPSVELIIASNAQGEITADAVDLDAREGKERYHLDISLTSLEEKGGDIVIPDFELESYETPFHEFDDWSVSKGQGRSRSLPLRLFLIGGAAIVVIWLCIWLFLTRGASFRALIFGSGPVAEQPAPEPPMPEPVPAPPPVVEPPPPVEAAPVPAPEAEVPVIEAPAVPKPPAPARSRVRSSAPVSRYKVPAVIPAGGVPYKIQWGDTLWEISEAFYRNPWLYPRIARFNNIRNPNRIVSGTTIRIPPRN
ncbi:MAG: LysM peptidoglycan-binding domain-containing protein [Spirochaetaceae bacterium]|jgi:LysM repeat protein|nr:LysM peptidoglycan-binding domain-containing protein [Spirochaetaceae bacterium]